MIVNKIKKAMSLGEVLICLAIVGLVAGITIPVITIMIPDKGETLHKKGDYILEHTVSDVVNNEDYYPVKKVSTTLENGSIITEKIYGLRNTDAITENGKTYQGASKFCELMGSKFNLYPGTEVDCSASAEWNFTSTDGIKWKMPVSTFATNTPQSIIFRTTDRREGNDCYYNQYSCKNPNLFLYHITVEGRLYKDYATNDKLKPTYE